MSNTTRDTLCVSPAADRFSARGPSAPRSALKWYELEANVVLEGLKTDASVGLTNSEAAESVSTYGSNELEGHGIKSAWLIVWEQLTSLMMLILLAAAAVSTFLGDYSDGIAIGAIVVLNALLGFARFRELLCEGFQSGHGCEPLEPCILTDVGIARGERGDNRHTRPSRDLTPLLRAQATKFC